jgi:sugar phosphate isomerase/epimerase
MKLSLSGRIVEESEGKLAMDLAAFLDMAAGCGYAAVDLRLSQLRSYVDQQRVGEVKRMLEERRLDAAFINLPADDELRIVGVMSVWLNTAVVLGARLVRASGSDLPFVREICKHAGPKGLRVAPQLHTDSLFDTPQGCLGSINLVAMNNCGVIVEPANLVLRGLPYDAATLAPIRHRIFGVNVQNVKELPFGKGDFAYYGRQYVRAPMGDAEAIDFPSFVYALGDLGYDGFMNVLEPKPRDMGIEEMAKHCSQYLSALI